MRMSGKIRSCWCCCKWKCEKWSWNLRVKWNGNKRWWWKWQERARDDWIKRRFWIIGVSTGNREKNADYECICSVAVLVKCNWVKRMSLVFGISGIYMWKEAICI
jgi:hypothetical protein